jgi:hypothetical protein
MPPTKIKNLLLLKVFFNDAVRKLTLLAYLSGSCLKAERPKN